VHVDCDPDELAAEEKRDFRHVAVLWTRIEAQLDALPVSAQPHIFGQWPGLQRSVSSMLDATQYGGSLARVIGQSVCAALVHEQLNGDWLIRPTKGNAKGQLLVHGLLRRVCGQSQIMWRFSSRGAPCALTIAAGFRRFDEKWLLAPAKRE
jgi:hypothetical protein